MNKNWRRVLKSQRERTNNGPQKKKKKKKKVDTTTNGWEKGSIRRAEEEEEEGERKARRGNGEVEARTDEVVDRVGVASQGCVCLARLVEIERDGSVVLFEGEW